MKLITNLHSLILLILLLTSTLMTTEPIYAQTFNSACPIDNPFHLLIDREHPLSQDYVPEPLVIPNVQFSFSGFHEKRQLQETAAHALENLFTAALSEDIHLVAISGYRSYDRQKSIYNSNVARDGVAVADTYSARPGTSEHQSGLAMDISSASANYALTQSFGDTKEGIWLATHAHEHGFTLSYPEGKEHMTGYMYEPWHVRYVGIELATYLYKEDLLLQELTTCCTVLNTPTSLSTLFSSTGSSLPLSLLPFNDIYIDSMTDDLNLSFISSPSNTLHTQMLPSERLLYNLSIF